MIMWRVANDRAEAFVYYLNVLTKQIITNHVTQGDRVAGACHPFPPPPRQRQRHHQPPTIHHHHEHHHSLYALRPIAAGLNCS
jgi:hypothetical protein